MTYYNIQLVVVGGKIMALIPCPECQKQISDKSEVCIHCGYPIEENKIKNNICTINGKPYDFSLILDNIKMNESMGTVIRTIRNICNMSLADAKKLYDIIVGTQKIPDNFSCEVIEMYCINQPKCPTCSSTNLKKISGLSKAGSVVMWGLLSQKVKKTYHCNNCGYE